MEPLDEFSNDAALEVRNRLLGEMNGTPIFTGLRAIQLLMFDLLVSMPGITEPVAISGVDALAGDVRDALSLHYAEKSAASH